MPLWSPWIPSAAVAADNFTLYVQDPTQDNVSIVVVTNITAFVPGAMFFARQKPFLIKYKQLVFICCGCSTAANICNWSQDIVEHLHACGIYLL